jgi:thiol-disulfide isomerase/thioredoxin
VGQAAPSFALRDLQGRVVRLEDLRGKVVWINFWATWCRPCKQELPAIQRMQDEHPDDLVVLAVNWQESADQVNAYWSDAGLRLRVLLDRSGGVYEQYGLQGLPDSFFVARDGTLAALHYGQLTEETMRKRLATAGLP